jgi:hypothetical protein
MPVPGLDPGIVAGIHVFVRTATEGHDMPLFVMPALVAGIHVLQLRRKSWMAGTSPAMTA